MEKKEKINSVSRPIPSSPGPSQITIQGNKAMKGGSAMTHPLPKENMIPDGSSKK